MSEATVVPLESRPLPLYSFIFPYLVDRTPHKLPLNYLSNQLLSFVVVEETEENGDRACTSTNG